ncbi:MAG: hypothetical protein VW169_10035 [Rhodospirillaceae bacterium]
MGGLAHFIEQEGIPTVIISLIRRHTEVMKPPRGLFVPFELGRPFGAANEPDFQRRVLLDAIKLLERNDGPLLVDFPDEAPGGNADDQEGWTCPVNFPKPEADLSDAEKTAQAIKQELALLEPWYAEALKSMNGRRLDGMTDRSRDQIAEFLTSWAADQSVESIIDGEGIVRALKLAADDLRHFYYQAAMAKPGIRSDVELGDWFYGETQAGKLFIKIREIMMNSDHDGMKAAGRTNYVPNAMLKHT